MTHLVAVLISGVSGAFGDVGGVVGVSDGLVGWGVSAHVASPVVVGWVVG